MSTVAVKKLSPLTRLTNAKKVKQKQLLKFIMELVSQHDSLKRLFAENDRDSLTRSRDPLSPLLVQQLCNFLLVPQSDHVTNEKV